MVRRWSCARCLINSTWKHGDAMADVTVDVITPATSFALLTVAELKTALGLTTTTQAADDQWTWLIEANSATVSELCNRTFAKEKVEETWRDVQNQQRIYLTHYPVRSTDIESVTSNGADRIDYELEESSGKLQIFTNFAEDIVVTYTGGFLLPDEAPLPLKQAAVLLSATWKAQLAMVNVTGVRMIAHKEARVMFHTPTVASSPGGTHGMGVPPSVEAILNSYTRYWV
jgi:hypothetical protein